jgi:hypothetical protein
MFSGRSGSVLADHIGPGHQIVDFAHGPAIDEARENAGEIGLGIDAVEFTGLCRARNYAEQTDFPQDSQEPACNWLGIFRPVPPLSTVENRMMNAEEYLTRSRLLPGDFGDYLRPGAAECAGPRDNPDFKS